MDPQACHSQLARMLADETTLLGLLEQQLQREHALLVANDVEGLEQAADARQGSIVTLSRLDQDRRGLCRLLGQSADQIGLAALLKWCDPSGTLTVAHAAASRQAQLCREQNDRNGALVNARLNRLNGMLDMLNGSHASSRTYGSGGAKRSPTTPPAGRMVSVSA
ncbi:MAG: flagellar protein FlgN [Steroidobacteraceae bacterium]